MNATKASTVDDGHATASKWATLDCGLDEHIRLPATVDGRRATAILDSGCTRTVIDRRFAASIPVPLQRMGSFSGMTASRSGALTLPLQIETCGMCLPGVAAGVLDLATLGRAARHCIDLFLGLELFNATVVEIDHASQRIRFSDDPDPLASMHLLPVTKLDSGLCAAPVRIADCLIDAVIDLGCSRPLFMAPALAEQLNLFSRFPSASCASAGVEGISISRLVRLPALTFGNVVLQDVPVEIPGRWNLDAALVIGLPAFSRIRSIMDLGRGRLWVGASGATQPFPRDRSGLGVILVNSLLRVIHVADNSPAARAGLKPGDDIVEVNGEPVSLNFLKSNRSLGTQAAGTLYRLSLASGRHIEMELRDYY